MNDTTNKYYVPLKDIHIGGACRCIINGFSYYVSVDEHFVASYDDFLSKINVGDPVTLVRRCGKFFKLNGNTLVEQVGI